VPPTAGVVAVRVNGREVPLLDLTLRVPHAKLEVRLPGSVVAEVEGERRAGGKGSLRVEAVVSGQSSNVFVHSL
jgi:hypothetical protein